jgi:hypothetical protein
MIDFNHMTVQEFIEELRKQPEVEVTSENEQGRVVVRHKPSDTHTHIAHAIIPNEKWNVLWEIIIGERLINPLYHVTRIIGYFSRVENWNKSKVGELDDRRKGDYGIPKSENAGRSCDGRTEKDS